MVILWAGTLLAIALGFSVGMRPRLAWMTAAASVSLAIAAAQMLLLPPSDRWGMPLATVGGCMAAIAIGGWLFDRNDRM